MFPLHRTKTIYLIKYHLRYLAPIQEIEEMYKAGPEKMYSTGDSPITSPYKGTFEPQTVRSIAVQANDNRFQFNYTMINLPAWL